MADLNFLNLTDCDAITFNTPTTPDLQYIEYVLGSEVKDFTNVDKYTITYSNNCCSPGITTNIAPRYQFIMSIDSCVSGANSEYTIKVDNINGNLVQSVSLSGGPIGSGFPFVPITFSVIGDELFYDISQALIAQTLTLRIITLSGFTYDIQYTVTQSAPGPTCDGVLSGQIIVYPTLPTNIVQSGTAVAAGTGFVTTLLGSWTSLTGGAPVGIELTADNAGIIGNSIILTGDAVSTIATLLATWNGLNPANTATLVETEGTGYKPAFGEVFTLTGGVDTTTPNELSFNSLIGSTTVLPGTYQIIFCEVNQDTSSTCIQNHIFIDCGTLKCEVVNKLVLCVDSNIMDFYNALVWSNDCTTTTTYAEICALYEILTIILATDGCYGKLDECNCSDASTIANKLSPVSYPTQTNSNPCSSC